MTVGELTQIVREVALEAVSQERFLYGIEGIAKVFGCSKARAQAIKNSGKIDGAITQLGRKIVIDRERAIEEAHRNQLII